MTAGCAAVPVSANRADFATAPSLNAVPRGDVRLTPSETLLLDVRLDRQQAQTSCGAHAASAVIDYWVRSSPPPEPVPPLTGIEIHAQTPPASPAGYSLAELVTMLRDAGLMAVAVGSTPEAIRSELNAGRPVIARVSLSAGYLTTMRMFPETAPLLGPLEGFAGDVVARMLEPFAGARVDHYWVVIGHDARRLIVLDPALGIRAVETAAFSKAFERGGSLAVVVGGWA